MRRLIECRDDRVLKLAARISRRCQPHSADLVEQGVGFFRSRGDAIKLDLVGRCGICFLFRGGNRLLCLGVQAQCPVRLRIRFNLGRDQIGLRQRRLDVLSILLGTFRSLPDSRLEFLIVLIANRDTFDIRQTFLCPRSRSPQPGQ